MDITSLYYFSELAKDLHMTRTANRLFLSQQTLSNHIQRLEEQCGTKLLYRKPKLSLTYAGEHVLRFANLVNREYQNLTDILADISHEESGVLRFGASTLRMNAWLPKVLPSFSTQYPNIELRLTETTSRHLEPLVADGDLDLAIVLGEPDNPTLHYIPLLFDQMYLCVSDTLLREYYGEETDALKIKSLKKASLKDFSKLPYNMLSNRMGQQIQKYFDTHDITPKIYSLSSSIQTSTAISLNGTAACFALHTSLLFHREAISEDMNIFPLYFGDEPFTQPIYITHHKDRYLSSYCKCFIDILSDYCAKTEQIPMGKLAYQNPSR